MQKVKEILVGKRKIYLGVTFLVLLFYSLYNFLFFCKFFPRDTFDSQLLLFWDYTVLHNLIPNQDIMYPYGFLFYYKNTSVFFSLIYILLFPTLTVIILLAFKKIIKNKIFLSITFLSFIFFILKYTGLEVFNRYGLLLGMAVLLSLIYDKYLYVPRVYPFLFGCLIGFIFSIINDIGLYIFFLYFFFSLFLPIFNNGISVLKTHRYYIHQTFTAIFFLVGILIGMLPIVLFFIKIENLATLFSNSKYLFDFPLYSKTPFLPSLRSTENIFNFTVMIITISSLFYKRIILKEKNKFFSYLQIGIVASLFFLLQKSVIRSIDIQITFLGFLLYMFLILEIMTFLKSRIRTGLLYGYYFSALFVLFYVIGLRDFNVTSIYFYRPLEQNLFTMQIKSLLINKQNQCLSQNLDIYKENKIYKNMLSFIAENDQDGKPFIFDYLTNPILYILFNEKSPFYFEVFGSSPLYAQESNIKYIEDNRIEYITYNTNTLRIKDGVPDYMRGSTFFKYIINNFGVLRKVDNFIILKKREEEDYDFFRDENLTVFPDFKNYLLNIDQGSIPRSEGIYKNELLEGLRMTESKYSFNSKDKILLVRSKNGVKNKKLKVTIVSDLDTAIVEFEPCTHNNLCIINLANIPLFYRDRVIKEVNYDSNVISGIRILDGIPKGIF